ncbi:MAG: glycyl-radical enzyme activating protein [Opitutales bacterium]|nr:glycyl-radical enzyme activating protein [Opitutales bacterium]MBP3358165.1 glycyl-radical enzyme activating protein [Opitutales bacterium]
MQGTIFSIEDFAVNDGPGIRTTVFLKGCPLCCQWCHNPEGISFKPQILIKKNGEESVCGKTITSDELAEKLLRDEKIFQLNEGGVTFTGGEPLSQADFLLDVLSKIRPRIHTAVETSGFATSTIFRKVVENVDLVLIDNKSTDAQIHKKYTGVDNTQILENLQWLCNANTPFIVRVPLIPTVNDSLENLEKLSDILKDAKNLIRVELLRYHKTAGAKYYMLGKEYKPDFDTSLAPKTFDTFTKNKIKHIIL